MKRATVIGGGSFGTALAQHLAHQHMHIAWWMRNAEQAAFIQAQRYNPSYLSDFVLHDNIHTTDDLRQALIHADVVICTLPSHSLRDFLKQAKPMLQHKPMLIGTKGLEPISLYNMHEVALDVLGADYQDHLALISGPSFATEIMQQQPTSVVIASGNIALAKQLAALFFCDYFRAYVSQDITGVAMGGALKNVMAMAAGALQGLGFGNNSSAALITRALAEMTRLSVAKGGNPMTMLGLAGVGDLILTCHGNQSRNRAIGQAIAEGKTLEQAIIQVGQVAEGISTTLAAYQLAVQLGIETPIIEAVHNVLYNAMPIDAALQVLLQRVPGFE